MIRGIIDDLCKQLSELRKKLQYAGFAHAETLVPKQGVGRGVVYALCDVTCDERGSILSKFLL